MLPVVQMLEYNKTIKTSTEIKTKYPVLYNEVVKHDEDTFSTWYNLSEEAFYEYLDFVREQGL
jgi:hypothetical protein